MDIRNAAKIQQALGEKAIVDGFVNMPLKNYVDSNWVADVNQDVCKWTFDINEARWALLDYGELIVHVFQSDLRRYYDLESFWSNGKRKKFISSG